MASESPKMEYRFLGRSGLKVSAIGLGGWVTYGGHVENRERVCVLWWQFLNPLTRNRL